MPASRRARWLRTNAGFGVGLVAVVAFSGLTVFHHRQTLAEASMVQHTHEVLFNLTQVRRLINELELGERGYLLSRDEKSLEGYQRARAALPGSERALRDLIQDNPAQSERLERVSDAASQAVAAMENLLSLARNGRVAEGVRQWSEGFGKREADLVRAGLSEMENEERSLLAQRLDATSSSEDRTNLILLLGGGGGILSLLLAAYALNRRLAGQLRAEAELKQFFDNSLDLFAITSASGEFLRVNQRVKSFLGYEEEEIRGRKVMDLVHPEDVAGTLRARERRQGGEALDGFEHRLRKKDGSYLVVVWHSTYDPETGLVYSVGRDETNRRRLEEENTRARQLAQAASQAKSDFLASMSHEIRTPMNAIIGMADVLSETPLTEEQGQYVRVFKSAGNSLLNLINDILDLSRIEAGRIEINGDGVFSPADLVESIVGLLSLKASQKGLVLEATLEPGLPPQVRGDADRVRQVLSNLVSNAVKFTLRGSVRVEVKRHTEGGQDGLLFTVHDTGLGIADSAKDKIFGRYERGAEGGGIRTQIQGTGLGLHISRQLAEKMGGRIWFDSAAGVGSHFHCWLPLRIATGAVATGPAAAVREGKPLRILLTDDNEDNRLIVVSYLKKLPHQVTQAENGARALELFRENRFDLVLMDLHMPVMDGLTAVREMRAWELSNQKPATPIVALTAYSLKEEEEKSLQAGCNAHLSKPIKKATLLQALADFGPRPLQ